MSDILLPRTITIRLTEQLATNLRRVARRESNPDSATARRILTAGLARELRAEPDAEDVELRTGDR